MRVRVFNRSGVTLSIGSVVHTSFTHSGAVLDPEQSGSPLYVFNCVRRADGKVAKTNGYIGVVTSLLGRDGAPGKEVEVQFGGTVKAKVNSVSGFDLIPGTRLRASDTEESFADDASDLGDFVPAAILMQRKDVLNSDLVDVFVPNQYWTLETFDNSTLQLNFLSGQLPTGLTFTRGTATATYRAQPFSQNWIPNSATYPTSAPLGTVTSNAGIAPDGTNTAKQITQVGTTSSTYAVFDKTISRGGIYTHSAYVKMVDVPKVYIALRRQYGSPTPSAQARVDLDFSTGQCTTSVQSNEFWTMRIVDHGAVPVGNGWYRLWVTAENISLATSTVVLRSFVVPTGATVATGNSFLIWGAQTNEGGLCDYVETTGSAVTNGQIQQIGVADGPRFEVDPATREPLGLLMEDATTNMLLRSQELATSPWVTSSGLTVTQDPAELPDPMGTANAFTLAGNSPTLGTRSITQSVAVTMNNRYTISVYMKKDPDSTSKFAAIRWQDASGPNFWVTVNLDTGATFYNSQNAPTGVSTSSRETQNVGNGWWRVSISFLAETTGNGVFWLLPAASSTQLAIVEGAKARFFGAQMETVNSTARPTSYIATGSGTASRSRDVCVMSGASFSSWYNATEGTFLFEGGRTSGSARYLSVNDGTVDNEMLLFSGTIDQVNVNSTLASVEQFRTDISRSAPYPARTNLAMAYKASDFGFAYNGTAQATVTGFVVPTTDRLYIGCNPEPRSANANVRRVKYWPYRLPNAVLAQLT
jgi:hypothetical protein